MRGAVASLFLIGAFSIVVARYTDAVPASAKQPPPAKVLRDCGTRGEGRSPQKLPARGIRLGPLVIWPSVRLDPGPALPGDWPYVIKAPIVLPARTRAVLAIAPQANSRAAFQSHRGWVSAVRFHACRERQPAWGYSGTVGKFTGFPFAIALKQRSACIPMEVWVERKLIPIRRQVPVGRRSC